MTRKRYRGRLAKFFDFIGLTDNSRMEDCVKNFTERGRKESDWVFVTVVRLAQTQEERVENREISPATLRNYVKAVKMFCEMNDIVITWKKITRDVRKARRLQMTEAHT